MKLTKPHTNLDEVQWLLHGLQVDMRKIGCEALIAAGLTAELTAYLQHGLIEHLRLKCCCVRGPQILRHVRRFAE